MLILYIYINIYIYIYIYRLYCPVKRVLDGWINIQGNNIELVKKVLPEDYEIHET